MDCSDYAEQIELTELTDGLPEVEQQQLLIHLVDCASCREYYLFSLRLEPLLQETMPKTTLPPLLAERVLSSLSTRFLGLSQAEKTKENVLKSPTL